MLIRPTRCPECDEAFNFKYQLPDNEDSTRKAGSPLWVDMNCKWCEAELSVDINQFRSFIVQKGSGKEVAASAIAGDLPAEIIAIKRAEKPTQD